MHVFSYIKVQSLKFFTFNVTQYEHCLQSWRCLINNPSYYTLWWICLLESFPQILFFFYAGGQVIGFFWHQIETLWWPNVESFSTYSTLWELSLSAIRITSARCGEVPSWKIRPSIFSVCENTKFSNMYKYTMPVIVCL